MPFDQVTRSIVKTFTYIVCHKRFCCYIENDIHKNVENELDLSMTKGVRGGGGGRKRNAISSLNLALILSIMT